MSKATEIAPFAKCVAFLCFVLSGAASISYEMIWLRQAMTYFGVINPVVSSVLSVFMAGLALGTWIAGKMTSRLAQTTTIKFYAITELLIGLYALAIPGLFKTGYLVLLDIGAEQSGTYLLWSWLIITAILLPVCTLIGSTFPLLMHYLRGFKGENNFGFLYYANLLGGVAGCILPLAIIEIYGFHNSLLITAGLNVAACTLALCGWRWLRPDGNTHEEEARVASGPMPVFLTGALFLFGFVTLGSEVLWIRMFISALGPTVYSFAFILLTYLLFSALGTAYYLFCSKKGATGPGNIILLLLPACALLPVVAGSMHFVKNILMGAGTIGAISFCLGYLTPKIVDEIARNDARRASIAYLFNFAGCILGPLFTTYVMFFLLGIKGTLVFYAGLLLVASLAFLRPLKVNQWAAVALFVALLFPAWHMENMEDFIARNGRLERDYVGYIGATGKGMDRILLVNGINMTRITTVTKLMAHLPLLHHPNPKSALAICFGMGTTTRSLTSWPLERITVAELSGGVVKLFPYFHDDTARVIADPRVRIVVDDGRRFLNRSHEQFDVITIDPPPPITSSGSGLLYTTEFLTILKSKLAPGGILAHWVYPWHTDTAKDEFFMNATINAIKKTFKYVRMYDSITPDLGIHILASDSPLPDIDEKEFVRRLPAKAAADLQEWEKGRTIEQLAAASLRRIDESKVLKPEMGGIYMSDDRLYNEFYLLRHAGWFDPSSMVEPARN